jgi:hypothetical protein
VENETKTEDKYIRHTAGYSLLHCRRNEDVSDELKVDPVGRKLAQHKQKRLNRVARMEDIRCQKQFLDYRPVGRRRRRRRRPGRPLKRDSWTDTVVRQKRVIYWTNFSTKRKRRKLVVRVGEEEWPKNELHRKEKERRPMRH